MSPLEETRRWMVTVASREGRARSGGRLGGGGAGRAGWGRASRPRPPPLGKPGGGGGAHELTDRELLVLRLLGAGRTNAQIGAELYISPTTAGMHVSNILRNLGVPSRVQAAAVAERASLLPPGQP